MNYISEINKFYDWLETSSVSHSAISLWHTLMHINNKCGWKVEFTVASSILELKSGLSNSQFKRARNTLEQNGRILWEKRSGNQCAKYSIIPFVVHSEPQSVLQSVPQTVPQSVPQSVPITKLNKTKHSFLLEKETKEKFSFRKNLIEFGSSESLVNDFLKVRQTKKATNSETAFNLFINQVKISKKPIDEILKICIEKDWKGFQAEWLKNLKNSNYNNEKNRTGAGVNISGSTDYAESL